MFQEYPKGLFKDGDPCGVFVIVAHEQEEAMARDAGFLSIGESKEKQEEPKRRGRKPKVVDDEHQ